MSLLLSAIPRRATRPLMTVQFARFYSSADSSVPFNDSPQPSTLDKPLPSARPQKAPSFLSLADFTPQEITRLVTLAQHFKSQCKPPTLASGKLEKSLADKTVALLFSKRSTRTRVASETSTKLLGGHSMFLGESDIQLGVNESLKDTSIVLGSMVDGIMARVGSHSEVETLAAHSSIPVINALSDLYHPTQTLASLLTLAHVYKSRQPTATHFSEATNSGSGASSSGSSGKAGSSWSSLLAPNYQPKSGAGPTKNPLECLRGLKVAWIGDCNNVVNDMIVAYPRLGIDLRVASPGGKDGEYGLDKRVWAKLEEFGHTNSVLFTADPKEALKDADVVVTDTWISMGQEEESKKRLLDFAGFQVTEELCRTAGANPNWRFEHCLPRHQDEVDDEVFYGPRSTVFDEAENRKWTIMAVFHSFIGKWLV